MTVNISSEHRLRIKTVGIDIGSATMTVSFSELILEKDLHKYVVVSRKMVNRPVPDLTPYLDDVEIDSEAVAEFVAEQFESAGITASEIEGGVTILTGTALLRANARQVAEAVAAAAGRLVVISAGDRLEGWLAAQGSGAVQLSADLSGAVLNVDIGGGTTKLTCADNGEVKWTVALDLGSRLIAFDEQFVVNRVEPAGRRVAVDAGIEVIVDREISEDSLRLIAQELVEELWAALPTRGAVPEESRYFRAGKSDPEDAFLAIVISGGVSEFFHEREKRGFGDLGIYISDSLKSRIRSHGLGAEVRPEVGRLGSTVLGASQFTVQVSGNTVHVSHAGILPILNVPVVSVSDIISEELPPIVSLIEQLRQRIVAAGATAQSESLALSVHLPGPPTRDRLDLLASALVAAIPQQVRSALVLIAEDDLGRTLGSKVASRVPNLPVVSVDGVQVSTMDFVDVGVPIDLTASLPVVVKSLVFAPS